MRTQSCYKPYAGRRGRRRRDVLCALLLLAALCFAALEGAVYAGARTRVEGECAVMVIFGCQVKPWGPSILLQDRLDAALTYLDDHPDTAIVVTGGQGEDEPVSEAQAMYDYLTARGVDGERILLEDRSRNTWQNIKYTLDLLDQEGYDTTDSVLLVSSGFHLTRIGLLWERAAGGTDMVSTLAAPVTHRPSAVKMFFREPLALVKSFLLDR